MKAQPQPNPNLVRLQRAVLCVNCEIISEGGNGRCDACGGQGLLHLSRALGGGIKRPRRLARRAHAGDSSLDFRWLHAVA